MYSGDKIRELEKALEWSSNSTGIAINGSTSTSFSSSPPVSSTLSPKSLPAANALTSSPSFPRHFVDTIRSGRNLPAIVRIKDGVSTRSSKTGQSKVIRVAPSDGGGDDYVAFCTRSPAGSSTSGVGRPPVVIDTDQKPETTESTQVSNDVITQMRSSDDTMLVWMTSLKKHRRAVFKTSADNRYLTFPIDSAYRFHVINHAGRSSSAVSRSESLSLNDAIEMSTNSVANRHVSFVVETDDFTVKSSCVSRLGRLCFVGHFDTFHLVGRRITADQTGELELSEVVWVPINATVTLEVATGLQRQPLIEFRNLKESLAKLNDALITSSLDEPEDIEKPSVFVKPSYSELALCDLQYLEPDVLLPVVPSASIARRPGSDAGARGVQPPPRRKHATYSKMPQVTEVGGNSSILGDQRPSVMSAPVSVSSDPRSFESVESMIGDSNVRRSTPEIVLPNSETAIIALKRKQRSVNSSPFVSLASSSLQNCQRTDVDKQPFTNTGNNLQLPKHPNSTVSLRRNASTEEQKLTSSYVDRARASLRASYEGRVPSESSIIQRSPMSEPRKVSKLDRVSFLAASDNWQQRDVRSLPSSPEISRVNGASLTRSSLASRTGSRSTARDELLGESSSTFNVGEKFTLRPAGSDHRPSPARLKISTIWTSVPEQGRGSPQETDTAIDTDVKAIAVSASRANFPVTCVSTRPLSEPVPASSVADVANIDGASSRELSPEQQQSLTANAYLCLIADDYVDSEASTRLSNSIGDGIAVGLQKRRLSSSMSDVKGANIFKDRPFSTSMININRPLPEIPTSDDEDENCGSRWDGGRVPFLPTLGSLSAKPLKKLFGLVTKLKHRRSGSEKSDGNSPTVDDDLNDDVELGTADQSPTMASRSLGERHVYEPLRHPVLDNASSVGDDQLADGVGVGVRWKAASEIPKDVQYFTVGDIVECLRLLKMDRYAEQFTQQDVDGALLVSLDEDLLQDSFGMTGLEARKIIQFAKKGWRPRT